MPLHPTNSSGTQLSCTPLGPGSTRGALPPAPPGSRRERSQQCDVSGPLGQPGTPSPPAWPGWESRFWARKVLSASGPAALCPLSPDSLCYAALACEHVRCRVGPRLWMSPKVLLRRRESCTVWRRPRGWPAAEGGTDVCLQSLHQMTATPFSQVLLRASRASQHNPPSPRGEQPAGASHLPRMPPHSPNAAQRSLPPGSLPAQGADGIRHTHLSVQHCPPQMVSASKRKAQFRGGGCKTHPTPQTGGASRPPESGGPFTRMVALHLSWVTHLSHAVMALLPKVHNCPLAGEV